MTSTLQAGLAPLLDWLEDYQLDEASAEQVRYLLLDHCANALGGLAVDSTTLVRRFAGTREGDVPAPGGHRVPEEHAALIAGASAHALETDDTHQASSSHPGAAVFPAALALAHAERSGFEAFAAAVVAGYEVMTRIGMAATVPGQYDRGFHPTGTTGVFGATIAAARLLDLDNERLRSALGIALSMSAGSMAFLADGSWTKRLHPGWAAHAGVTAARLAALGFEGPQDAIAGRYGYLHAYSDTRDDAALVDGLGEVPPAIFRTSIKAHACCRYKQAPIDAILGLVREHDLAPSDVERIRVGVLEAGWALIAEPEAEKRAPRSVVDAQFSMPFGAAVAVLHRSAGTREYRPEVIADPAVAALMSRVECYRSPQLEAAFPTRWPAEVEIELRDGRVLRESVEFPKGDPENPLPPSELADKFVALTGGVVTSDGQERVIKATAAVGRTQSGSTPADFATLLGSAEILEPEIARLGAGL